jgi:hypothetical protein
MAGTPKKRQALATIDARGAEVLALVEEGKSLREIEAVTGFPFQRIHAWLKKPEREEWYKSMKQAKAAACAEESWRVLLGATRDSIPVDREKAKNLQWQAERLDPDEWGNRPQVAVQVNILEAFVEALRMGNAERGADNG